MEKQKRSVFSGGWAMAAVSLLGTLAVAAYPVLFLYFQNAAEAHFSEVSAVLLYFLAAAAVLYGIVLLITKNAAKTGIIVSLFLLVLLNYAGIEGLIRSIFSTLYYWHILPILLVVLCMIALWINRKMSDELSGVIMPVACVLFCVLILINGVMAVPTITARRKSEQKQTAAQTETVKSNKIMPNIYYFIFDEYASNEQIRKYYDYDNSPLTDYLEKKGFNVSYDSHNESIITSTITTNLMNLDYVVDNSWAEYDKKEVRTNGKLFSLLRENGYSLYSASDFYGLPLIEGQQENSNSTTASGESLEYLLIQRTVAYPFNKKLTTEVRQKIDEINRFICEKETNRFLIAHLDLPHTPFFYDENGNLNANVSSDWHEKSYYLNQYIYTGKVMQGFVDNILKNDPESIVIIQSDHGGRASTSEDLFMVMFELNDVNRCFNAVYFKGEALDIEGLSGVNTLRVLCNRLLGTNYEMLLVPVDTWKYK